MNIPSLPDFMKLPPLQDLDQAREEIAFNDIVAWMMDDPKVMSEVVVALHTDVPIIEHGLLIRAIMTGQPADMLRARAVINAAIQVSADNRAAKLRIISARL